MPFYRYACVSNTGKRVKGLLEASTLEEAQAHLHEQQITILSVRPFKFGAKKIRLSPSNLTNFLSQLASLLKAGMPLYESLCEMAKGHLQEKYYPTLQGLCEHIQKGASLADAMRHYKESFSQLVIATVDSGQAAGCLAETLENLAKVLQTEQKRGKQFLTALLYPLILLGFSSVLILVLLMYVIPSLEMLFEERSVNGLTRFVIGWSHFVRSSLPYFIPLLLGGLFFIQRYFKSPKGKLFFQTQLLRVPGLRPLIVKKELGRFAFLMQVMLKGGVPLLKSLEIANSTFKLEKLKEIFTEAKQTIIEGKLLSHALQTTPLIPPLFTRLISIGEEGGNSAEMFGRVGTFYEGEVDKVLNRLTILAQPILLLVMGGVVGIIMLAVLLPLTDINAFM